MQTFYLNSQRQALKEYSRLEGLSYAGLVADADHAGRDRFRIMARRVLDRMIGRPSCCRKCCEAL